MCHFLRSSGLRYLLTEDNGFGQDFNATYLNSAVSTGQQRNARRRSHVSAHTAPGTRHESYCRCPRGRPALSLSALACGQDMKQKRDGSKYKCVEAA